VYLGGGVGPIERDYIIILASLAVCDELFSGSAGEFLILSALEIFDRGAIGIAYLQCQ
jgi:hypothetical protein